MTDNDRQTVVRLQLERAHRFLSQADEMYSLHHWDLAANRYYYACYHAVQGLFIYENLPATRKHASTRNQFTLQYVKTGRVELVYGSFFARMMELRQKADYNCAYDISEKDILDFVGLSRKFVTEIEKLINRSQTH